MHVSINTSVSLFRAELNPNIIQSTATGTELVTFIVTDGDIGVNGDYTLSLNDPSLPFTITNNSILTVNDALNAQTYDVIVVITDEGESPLSSSATVSVQVEPKNDFDPNIDESYMFKFDETVLGVGAEFEFTVTDDDIGGNGTPGGADVRLVPSEYSSHFNLTSDTSNDMTLATLVVTQPFDRENIATFNLTVEAFDTGYPEYRRTSEGTIVIIIRDVNDNHPVFDEETFLASVGENASIGHQFYQLLASDKDTDLDSELEYTLYDSSNTFAVDSSTGWLSVIKLLDRKQQTKYVLSVNVTDGVGQYDTATVNVTVTEVNDFAPQFVGIPDTVTIEENTDYSLNFSVYDNDSEMSGEFTLSMEQDSDIDYFVLEDTVLSLQTQLDYEVRERERDEKGRVVKEKKISVGERKRENERKGRGIKKERIIRFYILNETYSTVGTHCTIIHYYCFYIIIVLLHNYYCFFVFLLIGCQCHYSNNNSG